MPPQIDVPPKFLDHISEISITELPVNAVTAVLTICMLHPMK